MKLILICAAFAALSFFSYDLKPNHSKTEQSFVSPPAHFESYVFGYNYLSSSLFWVRALQDIELCSQSSNSEGLPSAKDIDDVLDRTLKPARCRLSWVYQMLDVITDLTPNFYLAYLAGGTFLSVLVDDREGAKKIFDKGLMYYPDRWKLLYRAAYHELFEMQNSERASKLLIRAGEFGAPSWVYALSASLLTKQGKAFFAKTILESVIKRKPDAFGIDRVKGRLDRINKVLEKGAQ